MYGAGPVQNRPAVSTLSAQHAKAYFLPHLFAAAAQSVLVRFACAHDYTLRLLPISRGQKTALKTRFPSPRYRYSSILHSGPPHQDVQFLAAIRRCSNFLVFFFLRLFLVVLLVRFVRFVPALTPLCPRDTACPQLRQNRTRSLLSAFCTAQTVNGWAGGSCCSNVQSRPSLCSRKTTSSPKTTQPLTSSA